LEAVLLIVGVLIAAIILAGLRIGYEHVVKKAARENQLLFWAIGAVVALVTVWSFYSFSWSKRN
jgi:amino acid transporter